MNPILGDFEGQKKASKKVRIGYKLGGTITVYSSVNGAAYSLIKTIDSSSWNTGYSSATFVVDGEWNKIQWKIEIT